MYVRACVVHVRVWMSLVVHVAGSPGSGKSFLGSRLAGHAGVAVIETDLLIQHHIDTGNALLALEEDPLVTDVQYTAAWRRIFGDAIRAAVRDAERRGALVVVLVGILNHWGGGETLDLDQEIGKAGVAKFFLDVDLSIVIARYYTRLSKRDEYGPAWWDGVARGAYAVASSSDLCTSTAQQRAWHLEHGYTLAKPDSVLQFITQAAPSRVGSVCLECDT